MLGRLTFDEVTTLATGVNGEVRKLGFTYDSAGRPEKFTSYNAGGSVKNQVQRVYNGFGQLLTEYQEHSTTVSTATSPKVQYGYSTVSSTSNASNRTTVTYPNDEYFLTYLYQFGRLTGVDEWDTDQLEQLGYLGLDSVVRRYWHNADDLAMAYTLSGGGTGEAGDKYTGLDRFGRVIEHRWDAASGGTLDAFKYGYDRNGNRLYRDNLLNNNFDELYHADGASAGYDNLNRLTEFQRGPLSDSNIDGVPDTVSTASRSQVWSLDALGNWNEFYQFTPSALEREQYRTHNSQNQLTAITDIGTLGDVGDPAYDASGNMKTDESGQTLVYDAWNRLMSVTPSGGSAKSYCYDALGRRIKETPAGGSTRDLYYSDQWQVLEERVGGVTMTRYAWSPVYVDAMIVRQHDADADGTIAYEERLYALQDANYNVTGLFDVTNGWPAVVERFIYDPYGSVTVLDANWAADADGQSDVGWVYLHQGGRFDWTTGLYHFRNRDHDPLLGRWLQQDPNPAGMYADGMNAYQYVGGSPVTMVDPTGLDGVIVVGATPATRLTAPWRPFPYNPWDPRDRTVGPPSSYEFEPWSRIQRLNALGIRVYGLTPRGWDLIRWLLTRDGCADDDLVQLARRAAIEHQPLRGVYGFGGIQGKVGRYHGEALVLGGYDLLDGGWYGGLAALGNGEVSLGGEWIRGHGGLEGIVLIDPAKRGPVGVGGFVMQDEVGGYVYREFGKIGVGGVGIYGNKDRLWFMLTKAYWTGGDCPCDDD